MKLFVLKPMLQAGLVVMLFLTTTPAFSQFYWQDEGVPVRQGVHLSWNGAMIAAGNDVALFYNDCIRDGTRDVLGQRLTASGERRWEADGKLISGNISEQRAPVSKAYSDGSVLVVWEDYAPGRYRDLVAQRYDQSGNAQWFPTDGVVIVEAVRDQYDVRLDIDENGTAYVVFTDDRLTDGPDANLGAYAQVITPDGVIVGPSGGIRLVDRSAFYNVPIDVIAVNGAAYVLVSMPTGGLSELVLQKISSDGNILWPEDAPVIPAIGNGQVKFVRVDDALAISWSLRGTDNTNDAWLQMLDFNRTRLSGWPEDGLSLASGPQNQQVVALSATADGKLLAITNSYQFDSDDGSLTAFKIDTDGELLFGPVELGPGATRSSPVSIAWDGNDAILSYAVQPEFLDYELRTQKLSPDGEKLWGTNGNTVFARDSKTLRADLVKPDSAPARMTVLVGRTAAKPETLMIAKLTGSGDFADNPDFVAGGLTHDIFDPNAAKISDDRLIVVWSDSRNEISHTVYYQMLDGQGNGLLEPQGRQLAEVDNNADKPPVAIADGSGGAFLAWIGVSDSQVNYLQVQRIGPNGELLWDTPGRVESLYGFEDDAFLIPDNSGGVFVAYSVFNSQFVTRPQVIHIDASGVESWSSPVEFDAPPEGDATIYSAATDGTGGLFVTAATGTWSNNDVSVFHLNSDGSFGNGWTGSGKTFGDVSARDYRPQLANIGEHTVLTYDHDTGSSTYAIMGVLLTADGSLPWGPEPQQLSGQQAVVIGHQLSSDNRGGFLLAWEDFRNGSFVNLYAERFDANGNAVWPTGESLVCDYQSEIKYPTLCHDSDGGAWIMWEDLRNSDDYNEIDLYATHLDSESGQPTVENGYRWPDGGAPVCDVPTYQMEGKLIPWVNGSAMAVWLDQRSSNPGRCCGAGAVGDVYSNVYAQVLSEASLAADDPVTASSVPDDFGISNIYPNPFNPSTTIAFSLPNATNIELSLFNILGQQVAVLAAGRLEAGLHETVWNASSFGTGLYFAQLRTEGGRNSVQKLTLLK